MTRCEGTAFAVLGLLPQLWLAVTVLALLGFGVAYSRDVALPSFIQTRTPSDILGRVNSVLDLPRSALTPVSIALMGLLATWNPHWCFPTAALPMLAVGVRRRGLQTPARPLRPTQGNEAGIGSSLHGSAPLCPHNPSNPRNAHDHSGHVREHVMHAATNNVVTGLLSHDRAAMLADVLPATQASTTTAATTHGGLRRQSPERNRPAWPNVA